MQSFCGYLVILLFSFISVGATAQESATSLQQSVTFTPIVHGSLVLTYESLVIYVDPYGGADRFAGMAKPDIVLITHPHGDHLHPKTLNGLDLSAAELIAPQSVIDQLGPIPFKRITKLDNGQNRKLPVGSVEAVPMYNLPNDDTARHPKGWGNGYVVTLGAERVYISGDTEDIPEMRALENIDLAFVCMNLPYTMDIERAAAAVIEFQPTVIVPYHYRNGDRTYGDVEKFKALVTAKAPNVTVDIRDWYPE